MMSKLLAPLPRPALAMFLPRRLVSTLSFFALLLCLSATFTVSAHTSFASADKGLLRMLEDYDPVQYHATKSECASWWRKWWSTEMTACVFTNFLSTMKLALADEGTFSRLNLEEFKKTRTFISNLNKFIHDPLNVYYVTKPVHIVNNLKTINRLVEAYDHYRKMPKEVTLQQLCSGLLQPPPQFDDIRQLELFDAFLTDSHFQGHLNDFTSTGHYKAWKNEHPECKDFESFFRRATYLGKRVPKLEATLRSLNDKLLAMHQARLTQSHFDPHIIADEAWLLDHVASVDAQYERLKNIPGIEGKVELYHSIQSHEGEVRRRFFAQLQAGDLLRYTMHLSREYKGKSAVLERAMPYVISGDSNHAAMVVRVREPNADDRQSDDSDLRPMVLHTLDSSGQNKGTHVQYLAAGEGYYIAPYRFNLDNLVVHDEFRQQLTAEATAAGLSLRDHLDQRSRAFQYELSERLREEFDPQTEPGEEPKYLIGNRSSTRFAVIADPFKRILPDRSGKTLLERAAQARAKARNPRYEAYLNRKIAELQEEVAEQERRRSDLTELKASTDASADQGELSQLQASSRETRKALAALYDKRQAVSQETEHSKNLSEASLSDDESASNEICSVFALIEAVRYLHALEEKFQEAYGYAGEQLFEVPFKKNIQFASFHPGRLEYELGRLEKQGKLRPIEAPGVFAPTRQWILGRLKKRLNLGHVFQ